jgi:hypothetical protein
MTDYRLGCLICNDAGKDEWFAQIVEPWAPGMFGYKVTATAMGIGRDATLAKVCEFAGISEVPPKARYNERTDYGVVQLGLAAAIKRCEGEIGLLAYRLFDVRAVSEDI